MLPIGPLMKEHRLIEKMLAHVREAVDCARRQGEIDPLFVDQVLDFIRTYADRTHHGKEEDILFRELGRKNLRREHARLMEELIAEHTQGRRMVHRLADALKRFREGDAVSGETILSALDGLAALYPAHIEKEDRAFFIPVMDYFGEAERAAMLEEMARFDERMIQEKYARMVEELGKRAVTAMAGGEELSVRGALHPGI